MARGRNQARKAARDDRQRRDTIRQLQEEVANLLGDVEDLTVTAAIHDADRQEIAALKRRRDLAARPVVEDLRARTEALRAATIDAQQVADASAGLFNRARDIVVAGAVSDLDAIMRWSWLIGLRDERQFVYPDQTHGKLSRAMAARFAQARGMLDAATADRFTDTGRPSSDGDPSYLLASLPWLRPTVVRAAFGVENFDQLYGRVGQVEVADDDLYRRSETVIQSDAMLPLVDATVLWSQPLLTDVDPERVDPSLGVSGGEWTDGPVDREILRRGSPAQLAFARDGLIAGASARCPSPLHPAPTVPLPGDAVTSRFLYTQHAIGRLVRKAETSTHVDVDLTDETTWADPARLALPEVRTAAALSSAMLSSVPFWLPAGQAEAMAESRPLDDGDFDEIRLPHQSIWLTFAQPLLLPATRDLTEDVAEVLDELDGWALRFLTSKQHIGSELLSTMGARTLSWLSRPDAGQVRSDMYDQWRRAAEHALAVRGGRVEGLLLLADDDGVVADQFAWGIAVPGRVGNVARVLLPARRSATAWRAQVDNLIAAVAWADWHVPRVADSVTREDLQDPTVRETAVRHGIGVRVMDVRRTLSAGGTGRASQAAPSRSVRPHARAGHWRRQHHGPGNSKVKRVRIAPTLVNAGKVSSTIGVYRLPARAATDPRPTIAR